MFNRPPEKRRPEEVQAAIDRARAYADAHNVPLTAERLAAELQMDIVLLRRIARGQYTASRPRGRAVIALLQAACSEATASVTEHAMSRGTSPNMHMLYLKNYAGYGDEPAAADLPAVTFTGEDQLL